MYCIRIEDIDFENIGLTVRSSAGGTGIPSVDANHYDLIGYKDGFIFLTNNLLEKIRLGRDVVRQIGKMQLKMST